MSFRAIRVIELIVCCVLALVFGLVIGMVMA
jgi:hypothetical protein